MTLLASLAPSAPEAMMRYARTLVAAACVATTMGCASNHPPPATAVTEQNSPMLSLRLDLPARLGETPRSDAPAGAPAASRDVARAVPEAPRDERFDLVVNSANTRDVFLALVADTRYSMLLHPEVGGTLSVTLKGVTLREALESIRDVYGYDFKFDGRRITVFPPTLQTRLFTVNYLDSQRRGRSDVRITSGSAPSSNSSNSQGSNSTSNGAGSSTTDTSNNVSVRPDSSQVSTSSNSDLWSEISTALRGMVGSAGGRSVIASPQSGVIAVRAMPDELRQVEAFLRSTRLAIERQVMLEAKIIEVELRDGYQSGIDWSILRSRFAVGQSSGYDANPLLVNANSLPVLPTAGLNALPDGGTGLLGLSLAAKGFSAVMGFLETHGEIQVLSSPRVATLNNQKAVLKVGNDEYFVTNVSGGTIAPTNSGSTATTTLPTVTLTPFFSGIALDVTPQIDEANMITLHIHPSVTAVTSVTKQVDLGAIGNYKLPLAFSSVNETDTVVRIPDGNIVAIGGLMHMESNRSRAGLPGSGDSEVSQTLFGNRTEKTSKKELVVLIKPTIIRSTEDWQQTALQAREALESMDLRERRVITVDGPGIAPAGAHRHGGGAPAAKPVSRAAPALAPDAGTAVAETSDKVLLAAPAAPVTEAAGAAPADAKPAATASKARHKKARQAKAVVASK